jgi:hypothetical protein
MSTPKPLSPAAQAVMEAAAVLRPAAPWMEFTQDHRKLQAIATELEGANG